MQPRNWAAREAVPGDDLQGLIQLAFAAGAPQRLGVAVSGGSDSLALLHLLKDWGGSDLFAVTVDHGLRDQSAGEAAAVGQICVGLGISHDILRWQGWGGEGNLQDQARRARYRLMADWAQARGIGHVALGHTADDQAETFLMRLARQAGIDGLAAMPAARQAEGVIWLRPLLAARRQHLRDDLTVRGVTWIDDPSNENADFDRVRARKALGQFGGLGLGVEQIAASAANLAEARDALALMAAGAADEIARTDDGDVTIVRKSLFALPPETLRRIVGGALGWVSSSDYGPRGAAMGTALAQIEAGRDTTLHGCRLLVSRGELRVTRELAAVAEMEVPADEIWDNRWTAVRRGDRDGYVIRALGEEGLRDCPDWRATGRPRAALIAAPAIWRDDRLVAAPFAGLAGGWTLKLAPNCPDFRRFLISR